MTKSKELAYWINERYEMKLRREAPEADGRAVMAFGYSDDPHMGLVRYCNVHREDDKVTKWLAKNWRPHHHAVWEIVLARMINYIPSLEEVLSHWRASKFSDPVGLAGVRLKDRRQRGEKVYTSAYTISTCGQQMDKIDYVMGVVESVRRAWDNRRPAELTLAEWHFRLTTFSGLGSFLAAQVLADLKNTVGHPLQSAQDWHTWCAPGPGSLKGLGEYFGRNVTPGQFSAAIQQCWEEVKPLINSKVPPIHMQDFQNCLCEFSKFERVKKGGHVRNKYRPGQD